MFNKSVYATALIIGTILPLRAFGSIPAFRPGQSKPLSFEVASIKPGTPAIAAGSSQSCKVVTSLS